MTASPAAVSATEIPGSGTSELVHSNLSAIAAHPVGDTPVAVQVGESDAACIVRPRRRWHGVSRGMAPTPVPAVAASGDAAQQTAMAVRSLTNSVNRFRAALADALEISPTDVLALTEIALKPALTPGELADRIGVGIAGTSTVIDRLVSSGFARRIPSTGDRRTYNLTLSPAGVHAAGWISDATRTAITDSHTTITDGDGSPAARDHAADGDGPTDAFVAHLNSLSAAYYRHADTLGSR